MPETKKRFEEHGKREQTEERAQIGDGVEAIGAHVGALMREPALEERPRSGKNKEGQADGCESNEDDVADGMLGISRFPAGSRSDGRGPHEGKRDEE